MAKTGRSWGSRDLSRWVDECRLLITHKGPGKPQVLTEDAWQDERRFKVTTGDEWFGIFVQTMGIFFGIGSKCERPPLFAQILVIWVANSNNKNIYHLKSSKYPSFHHSVLWISGALKELQGPISQYGGYSPAWWVLSATTDSAKPLSPKVMVCHVFCWGKNNAGVWKNVQIRHKSNDVAIRN